MKKLILALLLLASLAVVVRAVDQYNSVGAIDVSSATFSGGIGMWDLTIAQINALTPTTTGQVVGCSNCVRSGICKSTGVLRGAFAVPVSTATFPLWSTIDCE